jgi:hypothetical protein
LSDGAAVENGGELGAEVHGAEDEINVGVEILYGEVLLLLLE